MEKLKVAPIIGYEKLYSVNENGEVYSYKTNKILKGLPDKDGYLKVMLYGNGKPKRVYIHRLVAYMFISNPTGKPCVNHKNEIKTDNRIENLEWVTHLENNLHNDLQKRIGEKNKNNGKTNKPVGQYDLEGTLIRTFVSTKECGRLGFDQSHVSACCRGIKTQFKGFVWRYLE